MWLGRGGKPKLCGRGEIWRNSEALNGIYTNMLKNIRDCGRSIGEPMTEFQYQISLKGTERLCREHYSHWTGNCF